MSRLIRQVYAEWKSVKKRAEQDCENRALFNMAEKYRKCCMLKGTEDIEQIAKLFLSPQGVEFCQKNSFPDLHTLRQFKQYNVERFGVFIDAGDIDLRNVRRAVLVGNTNATIAYDSKGRYELIMMHDAKANITASGWALVFVTNKCGCKISAVANDRARIL
jgi:hypothetical protein